MEKANDISILIALLPQYRLINSLYEQVADSLMLSFEWQCHITDFYNTFKDTQAFEKAVLNLLLATDKEKSVTVVNNLRIEINKNLNIYIAHKEPFDKINTLEVCSSRYEPLYLEIEGQLKDTNKFWQELTQIRNSLESASWKNDNAAIQRLTKEEERVENLYRREQEKLNRFYQLQKESDEDAFQYIKNVFSEISKLSSSFSSLLDNYFPVEKEKEEDATFTSELEPIPTESESTTEQDIHPAIEPDMIFMTNMYNKFLLLEKKLITDKYLEENLNWTSVHDNGKPDIKRLVTFLVGLLDNKYFMTGRDPKIKTFFENRYYITIGQNFEPKRREPLLDDYPVVFCDYPF
ncbi:hypothetical protein KL86DYS2_10982 [uncultured Dysgonomonas sp.]|uniref:Uncharacterized protein n=1 Tax=uncultured Dysgonomonas sp. TaxID=206096 RepID=A0A212J8Q0_9BACT|nr:hypothetical protein [uncultured Dysgonomonas sp.]SBV95834.1 hypothetical protein KL86DYS2_10982 [uncultured Dysgonomonas sp.]